MAGSLIRRVTSESAIGYGVNILERQPPGAIGGAQTNRVGVVADLPWGPVNEVTRITTSKGLFDSFSPSPFGVDDDYPALKAFLNKQFVGGLDIVRIAATGAAASTLDLDASAADSGQVDALYPGAVGNQISVEITVNASDADARDVTVRIGTSYAKTYLAVYSGGTSPVVTDPGDPYVVFTLKGGAVDVPDALVETSLAGGADGSAVAADYTGGPSSIVGIRKFYSEQVRVNVLFVAECPSALVDAVNTGLKGYVDDNLKGMAVLCTPAGDAVADAISYVASYRSDRLVYTWPQVETTNFFDPDLASVQVDGNSFAAAAMVFVAPENSPGGASGADALKGITDVETDEASKVDMDDLNDAGVAPWFISDALGPIMRRGVTTSITSGLEKIFRRRMADFIADSIADRMENYVELPLDLDLANQSLGPVTAQQIGEIKTFLSDLESASRIKAYSVDPYSGNTESNIDAGQFRIIIRVELFSAQEEIVIEADIGERVVVDAA